MTRPKRTPRATDRASRAAYRPPSGGSGRPCRDSAEIAAVSAAFAAMPAELSTRACAAALARRVVRALRIADQRDEEPLEAVLQGLRSALSGDPVTALVEDEAFGAAGMLARARLAKFEARGCRQLAPAGWKIETESLLAAIETKLATRYRRGKRNWP